VKEPAKKIAVFRNAYGETKSVDLTNAPHFIVERPVPAQISEIEEALGGRQ